MIVIIQGSNRRRNTVAMLEETGLSDQPAVGTVYLNGAKYHLCAVRPSALRSESNPDGRFIVDGDPHYRPAPSDIYFVLAPVSTPDSQ